MNIDALRLLTALIINEVLHNLFEIWGIRQKVQWLNMSMHGKPHSTWPINIDNNRKVWLLHITMMLLFTSLAYWLLGECGLVDDKLVAIGVGLLIGSYIYTVYKVHFYHSEIGFLIRIAKGKSKKV